MKPIVAITMGDPCGIGPEVIVKALLNGDLYTTSHPFVIGDVAVMQNSASAFAPQLDVHPIQKVSEAVFQKNRLEILDMDANSPKQRPDFFQPGVLNPKAAAAAFNAIETAAALALAREIDAIATAPINKEGMKKIGFAFPGHTEFFAKAANEDHFGMMMTGGHLKIMLASIHLPLRDAIAQLNPDRLLKTIRLADATLKQDFGLPRPHIAVAGLNPHAGERGILGQEEKKAVVPAIHAAQEEGLHVSGPYPADTLFYKLSRQSFDAAVALYHDQALIPIKLIAFGRAVNFTAGLPFIRASVDHGTAFDIAGKGVADPGSLKAAVKLAAEMAVHRYAQFKHSTPMSHADQPDD
ncbi:MAG: 4-hydroxythreonine-4-phosphate dehydrogenase PdxA [Nitrospiria bacterium]